MDHWVIEPDRLAVGGWTVAQLKAAVPAWIASATTVPTWAFVNIGVNDLYLPSLSQATYEADMGYILDALHAAWPDCAIGVSKVWIRGYDDESDDMAGWTDNVVTARAGWATPPIITDDERSWMKGADDGATMTNDGAHPNTTGNAAKVVLLKTAMGY